MRAGVRFYLWTGLGYLGLSLLTDIHSYDASTFIARALNEIWRTVYITLLNYLFFEYILPALSGKKFIRSVLLVFGMIILSSYGLFLWRKIGLALDICSDFSGGIPRQELISQQFGATLGSVIFFRIIKHVRDHIKLRSDAQLLRIEKQAAELNYLKSQTNPHFLFNTLNNIYSLARDKSNLAPESILRLSKLLRFMLYETGGKFIPVEKELKIIRDYIELEKLRYDESLQVNFSHDLEDLNQALPPLLLLPLVENAFKHGVSETRNHPFVNIHLSINRRQLSFVVENSVGGPHAETGIKESIGLSNLKRQLELLFTDYSLSAQPGQSVFSAILKINLASHV
jgi:hypothetical protein